MRNWLRILVLFFVPAAVIFLCFRFNLWAGLVSSLAYLGWIFYNGRAGYYGYRANLAYQRKDEAEAVRRLKRAYETGRPSLHAVAYGYLLLRTGNIAEAERVLSGLLNKELNRENKMAAKSNMALVLWKKGRLDEAVRMLEEVYREYKTTTVYGSLGYLLILQGDLDRALAFNLEAREYNDADPVILDNLGQTYYLRGELDKAEEIYVRAAGLAPKFPEPYYHYGLVLLQKNKMDAALQQFREALKHKTSFLSTVTHEEIERKIAELKIAASAE